MRGVDGMALVGWPYMPRAAPQLTDTPRDVSVHVRPRPRPRPQALSDSLRLQSPPPSLCASMTITAFSGVCSSLAQTTHPMPAVLLCLTASSHQTTRLYLQRSTWSRLVVAQCGSIPIYVRANGAAYQADTTLAELPCVPVCLYARMQGEEVDVLVQQCMAHRNKPSLPFLPPLRPS